MAILYTYICTVVSAQQLYHAALIAASFQIVAASLSVLATAKTGTQGRPLRQPQAVLAYTHLPLLLPNIIP